MFRELTSDFCGSLLVRQSVCRDSDGGNVAVLPRLCRKVTVGLIGINQLAAPVEWRRRDLRKNGIDPKREVETAPGPALVPIHLPQQNIIIPTQAPQKKKKELL